MIKPIIFFSHSSKDKEYLKTLKNKILTITSNTIEVFQSSDGESIPFGNNWIHKIEENLKNCKIMFVFISPNSLRSNWIYFESGFAYSKGVKVIPIGINGIDIGKLAPPINLLQGFNITSHEGLNNIITIINREFTSSFPEDFQPEDHQNLITKSPNFQNQRDQFDLIDYIETNFHANLKDNKLNDDALINIKNYLKTNSIKFSTDDYQRIYLHGAVISRNGGDFQIKIDQLKLTENLKIIADLINLVYEKPLDKYWFRIKFFETINLLTVDFKLSSRLQNIGIEMSEEKGDIYSYKSLLFALDDIDKIERTKGFGKD